jgi:DNA-binding transcriptional MocR family regulator
MDAIGTADVEMALGSWSAGRGALHVKLANALRRAVDHRVLVPGRRLPSERELARQLVVSRSTVVAAYDALRGEGLLESRRGSGTRVAQLAPSTPLRNDVPLNPVFRSLLNDDDNVISLACAINPVHPAVRDAVSGVAADAGEALLTRAGYLPLGLPELRARLAQHHTDAGLPTTPEQIIVTTGAQQAVNLCAALLVQPGDRVVVESPSFAGTIDAFRAAATRFVPVPVDTGGVDVRGVRDAIERDAPSLVYLIPTFHNPTGVLLERSRREELAELSQRHGVPIVEDNALEHMTLDDHDAPPPIAASAAGPTPIFTIGSFGKLAWGGLRVGWLRAPAAVVGRLGELKACADLGTPLFDQAVAARLLDDFDRMRDDRRAELQRGLALVREFLTRELPAWEWQPPAGGVSLWIRLPRGTAAAYAQVALRHGVEVIPGAVMSPTSSHGDYFRLPFTAPPEQLDVILHRLAAAWDAYTDDTTGSRSTPAVVV